jgi:hypothetical protein
MDEDVLQQHLDDLCKKAVAEARAAVDAAPDGRWIAASEWQVRDVFQRLTRDCYQAMLQAKADAHPTASGAVFSPGGPAAAAAEAAAEQGRTPAAGPQRGG